MKDFPVAVDLGCGFGSILKNWSGHGEIEKLYMCDMSREFHRLRTHTASP